MCLVKRAIDFIYYTSLTSFSQNNELEINIRTQYVSALLCTLLFTQKVHVPFTFSTVNSRFKKDLTLQIYLRKAFFSAGRLLDSLYKSFLNQTTLALRIEKSRVYCSKYSGHLLSRILSSVKT